MLILLFPGSFSPFTDGHYGLISRYLSESKKQNEPIEKVIIFLSSKEREGIDAKSVFKFISQIYSNDKRVEVKMCDESPIKEVYSYVYKNQNEPNTYIFLRSDKDDDSLSEDFYSKFEDGKVSDNIKVKRMDDVLEEPIVYKNRDDEFKNKPISASVVREDIRHNDFEKFLTSYQSIMKNEISISENHLKKYFKDWKGKIQEISKESEEKLK